MSKTVGILGGMGPLATVDLFAKIVANTPAVFDQDHLRIIIDNNPKIPPRVEAILQGAESPLPMMSESARMLEAAGADFIVIPCNTAHYWIDDLRAVVNIPIYSMIENAAAYVSAKYPELSGRIILLATGATIGLNLYQKAFAAGGIDLRLPTEGEQAMIHKAIRQIKAGRVAENPHQGEFNSMLDSYAAAGAAAILVGCTELPLLLPSLNEGLLRFDATLLLAQTVVELATDSSPLAGK